VDVPEDLYINGLLGVYELNRIELMRDVLYGPMSGRAIVIRQYGILWGSPIHFGYATGKP
jgi:hypothetical protein